MLSEPCSGNMDPSPDVSLLTPVRAVVGEDDDRGLRVLIQLAAELAVTQPLLHEPCCDLGVRVNPLVAADFVRDV